jgi:hypothetical protein
VPAVRTRLGGEAERDHVPRSHLEQKKHSRDADVGAAPLVVVADGAEVVLGVDMASK